MILVIVGGFFVFILLAVIVLAFIFQPNFQHNFFSGINKIRT